MKHWTSIELLGYTYFSEKKWNVCTPLVRDPGYDFIAEKQGKTLRVNVKLAGLKDKRQANSWSISVASGNGKQFPLTTDVRVDIFLVWLPSKEKFIELPNDFFNGSNSKSKHIPKEFFI